MLTSSVAFEASNLYKSRSFTTGVGIVKYRRLQKEKERALQALLCALLAGYHKLLHRVLQIDRFMATGHKRTAYPKPN